MITSKFYRLLIVVALAWIIVATSALADTFQWLRSDGIVRPVYVTIQDHGSKAWNGSAMVTWTATRATFAQQLSRVGSTYLYTAATPSSIAPQPLTIRYWDQVGGSPSDANDVLIGVDSWDGVDPLGLGGWQFTDTNDEPVPDSRTWTLKQSAGGLIGDFTKGLRVGDVRTFSIDFVGDLPTNGRVVTVGAPTIFTGTNGGVTFGPSGRDHSKAKVRITGVTVGTYVLNVTVTYDSGAQAIGYVTLIVN
jgi:hypothetical protein